MRIENRALALALRCVLLACCGYGLAEFFGLFAGRLNWGMLVYYTNLSNLVCFAYFLVLAVKTAVELRREGARGTTVLLPRLKGAFMVMITLTLLVYHFMLSGIDFSMMGLSFNVANRLLHYVTPALVILDWLLFDEKGAYRLTDPLPWTAIPLLYLAFALVRAEVGGILPGPESRYPYFFLDVDVLGAAGVALYSSSMTAGYVVLGYLFVLVDRVLIRRKEPPNG